MRALNRRTSVGCVKLQVAGAIVASANRPMRIEVETVAHGATFSRAAVVVESQVIAKDMNGGGQDAGAIL